MTLLESLNWRYATKKMNGTPVPQDKVDFIIEAARLAPSSSGLQPYEIIVISNKDLLEKIKPIANGWYSRLGIHTLKIELTKSSNVIVQNVICQKAFLMPIE